MTPRELNAELAKNASKIVKELLPSGSEHKGCWEVGSTSGESGESLKVKLSGEQAGLWHDWATGEGGNIIDLIKANKGTDLRGAFSHAYKLLGVDDPMDEEEQIKKSRTWAAVQREMGRGTEHDIEQLTHLRKLPSDAGIRLAIEHDVLFFAPLHDHDEKQTHHCWLITDDRRLSAQARRMDGKPFGNGSKTKNIDGTKGVWPIGIARPFTSDIALVEGGPDFLAAYTVVALNPAPIQPVAILGASVTIHGEAVKFFANRLVWMFPHNDDNIAGLRGAIRWEKQLSKVGAKVVPFDFRPYGVKDLNDYVSAIAKPTYEEVWEE